MTKPEPTTVNLFTISLSDHIRAIEQMASSLPLLQEIADSLIEAIRRGGTIFWCGNGGSAADAQHMAAELVGRFRRERRSLASLALTTDTSILTALANDYSYDYVFVRQVESLCRKGDVLIGISTSGNSANVCNALQKAKEIGAYTVAITGGSGGKMLQLADGCFLAPSKETARIQECHELALHMICDWVEHAFTEDKNEK
ncbi:phosphoheptose isomerase [Candidatus Koribacter versatilis Ellin345]|uniref:Phosphoheptose isomerase n=1 Tax=Koribacter versatilis (strain Ellin345) TaxID=204669 RepID=Q1IK10_KORVE|nr:D-sedoheptulose 7-phosphate isomerase [Candidatus Koribacter versatilis]ABF42790.1 phosphoheptose isomerase [Candidatus Koribacter versatilis Ellin345]